MKKYKVQLSEYGTVASRADIEIYAKDENEADKIAVKMAREGSVEFENERCVDGWEYQTENIEESK
tara:strand:+ start:610 stop:807 length:198 start_codon:yes stop_codon:yes gene_type:complete